MNNKKEMTSEQIETSNKVSIVFICISLLVIVVFCLYYLPDIFPNMDNKNSGNVTRALRNTNENILAGANMGPIVVNEVILETKNGKSTYKAVARNNTDQEYYVNGIKITYFHDENVIGTLEIMVNKSLRPNQSIEIKAESDVDFTKANSANYEFINNN